MKKNPNLHRLLPNSFLGGIKHLNGDKHFRRKARTTFQCEEREKGGKSAGKVKNQRC